MGCGRSKPKSNRQDWGRELVDPPAPQPPEATPSLAPQTLPAPSSGQRNQPSLLGVGDHPKPESLPPSRPPQRSPVQAHRTALRPRIKPPPSPSTGARHWGFSLQGQPGRLPMSASAFSSPTQRRFKLVQVVAKGCESDGHALPTQRCCPVPGCACKIGCGDQGCFLCSVL